MRIEIVRDSEHLYYVVNPSADRTTDEYIRGIVSLLETEVVPGTGKTMWRIEDLHREHFEPDLPEVWYIDKDMALAVAAGYFGDGTPVDLPE